MNPHPYATTHHPRTVRERVIDAIDRLDPQQRAASDAIRAGASDLRIAAGAGSGKTTLLVSTLAALLVLDNVHPEDVVAVTFTRKAGDELTERLGSLLGTIPKGLEVGTWHRLALRLLRGSGQKWPQDRCLELVRFGRDLPTEEDLWGSIVDYRRAGVYGTGAKSLGLEVEPRDAALLIGVLRGKGLRPGTPEAKAACRASAVGAPLHVAWTLYEDAKRALRVWDFADAIDAATDWLRTPDGRRTRPRWVLVDEAQDNDGPQLHMGRVLAGLEDESRRGKLVLTGDGGQAIYAWRGADIETFCKAPQRIPGIQTVPVGSNYRSTAPLVAVGNAVADVVGDDWNAGLRSVSARLNDAEGALPAGPQGAAVRFLWGSDELDAAYSVADYIAHLRDARGVALGDVTILLRTNDAAALYEGALMDRGLPAVRWGGVPFWSRNDVLAYLAYALLADPDHPDTLGTEALRRVINRPKRYLSRAFVDGVEERVHDHGETLIDAIRSEAALIGSPKIRTAAKDLADAIRRFREGNWAHSSQIIADLLVKGAPVELDITPDEQRSQIPRTCAAIARRFESGRDFVQYAIAAEQNTAKEGEGDRHEDRVTLSTVHRYKGLEARVVVVPVTAGQFPHTNSLGDPDRVAEELRLFYVAVTRARDHLVLVAAGADGRGSPRGFSPFAKLIPGWQDYLPEDAVVSVAEGPLAKLLDVVNPR